MSSPSLRSPPSVGNGLVAFDYLLNLPDYRVYARALQDATGLMLSLVPAEDIVSMSHNHDRRDIEFCRVLQRLPKSGLPCGCCWQHIAGSARNAKRLRSTKCPAGIIDLALPVFSGDRHVGTLLAGKVFHHRRQLKDWRRVVELAEKYEQPDLAAILCGYRAVPVIPAKRFRAACVLLNYFARILEERLRSWHPSGSAKLPASVQRAKDFIRKHAAEPLTLKAAAQATGLSVQHFSEVFKRHTGLTFTHYLARERVEGTKALLQKDALQVAEVAFASGFESITTFNRVFKRWTGKTPTQYRRSFRNGV